MNSEWIEIKNITTPLEKDITQALACMGPDKERIPDATMTADTVVVPWVYIEPLVLFHPLLYSPILSPSNTCHHIDTRVKNLGLEERVAHFMDWIIAQTKQPKKTINSLDIFDLEKYHCRLDKRYKKPWCIPPSKPTPCNHPVPTKPARGHSDTDHTKTIHGAHRTMGGRPVNTSQVPQRHRRT